MKAKKSLIIAGAVASIGLSGAAGLAQASAATNNSSTGVSGVIDKLANKFKLNKDDVKAVFDTEKTERQAERQADLSTRLQKLVDAGTITAAQKTLIENKQKELQTVRETERTELEAWATSNGIDQKYIMMGGHRESGNGNRLQKAVDDGDITAAQKTLIEAKQAELQTKREAARTALTSWAKDNNINQKYLMGGEGGGHRGRGGPF